MAGKEKNIINMVFGGTLSPTSPPSSEVYSISQTVGRDIDITFIDADLEGIYPNHNEAFVVNLEILDNVLKKVLIDNDSSVDIMFMHCWERLKPQGFKLLKFPEEAWLYSFGHNAVPVVGVV